MADFFTKILYIPFYNLLIYLAWAFGGSVGWAIIILTVIVRIILLPSSIKAAKAATKMQALQPRMNEIKEKHKGDQKKQSEETMKMYKEEGTSPFGSCLPLLIQLPIIFVLYRVFMIGIDTSKYDLLYSFTPRPEVLDTIFLGFDLSVPDLWVLPILAGVLQFLVSWMTMPKVDPNAKKDAAGQMTRQMMYLFPIMTVFIARSLPAALAVYWIITTIFSVGQQWYVNKNIKKPIATKASKNKKQGTGVKQISNSKTQKKNNKSTNDNRPTTSKKKPDIASNIMKKRLNKTDKKKGVEVIIREKGKR